ncbi:S-adenosyl-L-methionine-dependent methyltransferase [Lasiosphaeris hirsuta]|uniref:S-adenosyl-L-methionine-dependent methyltransferase n=1 Tax=Lasiosphaeris hirsuta TaxID=260670 RepID=A0AA40ARN4_9PEZI|nr:S-adenosyl-L-methionine-dependent methyltransferase [Lasiosphaeris hirsuta]
MSPGYYSRIPTLIRANRQQAIDGSTTVSSLTSITSSVLQGKVEDGRVYAVYGKEEYGMPMDEAELDRIDMAHAKYYALLEKKRFLAPIGDNPQRVLDLGCGTGIWSIDFADMFPTADVIGVDIAPTQPEWVPPNCRFELDDMEARWTWKENSFDYIFSRDLILAIRDWPKLVDQVYTHLKPGGWVEFQCVTGVVKCDDASLPPDSMLREFSKAINQSTAAFGTPVDDPARWRGWFEDCGFEEVTEVIYKLPMNPWPKDQRLKLVGAFEMENLLYGLSGMVTRLFAKTLNWTPEQVEVFLAGVRKELKNRSVHTYWPFYIVYARKPGGRPTGSAPPLAPAEPTASPDAGTSPVPASSPVSASSPAGPASPRRMSPTPVNQPKPEPVLEPVPDPRLEPAHGSK